MKEQQKGSYEDTSPEYLFQRKAENPTDSREHGVGSPVARTGLIKSAFRPSDDATKYSFLIPANAMAVVELRAVAPLLRAVGNSSLAAEAEALATEVSAAIEAHGILAHPATGKTVYAYEVDGFGNALFADDANIPSLLSLPLLGFLKDTDPVYLRTRSLILSNKTNPYYYIGKAGIGSVGGPHNGFGFAWPMALVTQMLTSNNKSEVKGLLADLVASSAGTGLIHESFQMDSVSTFTRPWFAWVNTFFGAAVLEVGEKFPDLVYKSR